LIDAEFCKCRHVGGNGTVTGDDLRDPRYRRRVRDRLTKAQVEALLAHLDGPAESLAAGVADAVAELHGTRDVAGVLDSLGRHHDAARVRAGDEATLWSLATELNELRRLAPP
jgi:hypothetical protein